MQHFCGGSTSINSATQASLKSTCLALGQLECCHWLCSAGKDHSPQLTVESWRLKWQPMTNQETLYKEGLVRESQTSAPRLLHHCCSKKHQPGKSRAFYSLSPVQRRSPAVLSDPLSNSLGSVQISKSNSENLGLFSNTTSPALHLLW